MDRINIDGSLPRARDRYFARASGTAFTVHAEQGAAAAEVELYDEIGYWGVTAKDFKDQIKGLSGNLTVKINSPGGDVFDGIAMYNELIAYPGRVRVEVMGLAASAASVVAMAGDEIAIAENGFLMIHNAWVLAIGNRHDLTEASAVLAKIDGALARTYANRSGMGVRTIGQMMDDETWLSGPDAVAKGLATEALKPVEAQAKFDLSVYAKAPEGLRWAADEHVEPETIRDVERELMRDAGTRSRAQARALIRACKTNPDAVTPDADAEGLMNLLRTIQTVQAEITPHS